MFVKPDDLADYAPIFVEAAVPIPVAQHDIGRAVAAVFVGGVKKLAQVRLNPQHIEVVATGRIAVEDGRILARIEPNKNHIESCQVLKAVVAIAQVDIVWVRLPHAILCVHGSPEAVPLRHVQRTQEKAIQDAKNDSVCTDGQRQGDYGCEGESGRLAQHPQSEPDILHQRFEKVTTHCFVAFLFVSLTAAKLDPRLAFRLRPIEA